MADRQYTFVSGQNPDGGKLETELSSIFSGISNANIASNAAIAYSKLNLANSIVNADVNTAAAISHSKLASMTAGNVLLGNASNVPTSTAVTGDVTINSSGTTAISNGVIINSDINASAAIDFSKLASLSSGNILLGNGSNVATSTAVTGDVTISNAGVTAIASGVIVNADVNASAAIDISKTTLGTYATWANWTPTYSASGSMTWTSVTTNVARYCQIGKVIFFYISAFGTTGGTASYALTFTLPTAASTVYPGNGCLIEDSSGNVRSGFWLHSGSGNVINVYRYDAANYGLGTNRSIIISGHYEVS